MAFIDLNPPFTDELSTKFENCVCLLPPIHIMNIICQRTNHCLWKLTIDEI